jgi:hypothetical protein
MWGQADRHRAPSGTAPSSVRPGQDSRSVLSLGNHVGSAISMLHLFPRTITENNHSPGGLRYRAGASPPLPLTYKFPPCENSGH